MGWTAPERHQCAKMVVVKRPLKETVHGEDYHNWAGSCEAGISGARGRCLGRGGVATSVAAEPGRDVLLGFRADVDWNGSLRHVALLGPLAASPGPRSATDAGAICEGLLE